MNRKNKSEEHTRVHSGPGCLENLVRNSSLSEGWDKGVEVFYPSAELALNLVDG